MLKIYTINIIQNASKFFSPLSYSSMGNDDPFFEYIACRLSSDVYKLLSQHGNSYRLAVYRTLGVRPVSVPFQDCFTCM